MGQQITNHIVLQDRDMALIRLLADEFRVLTREQIGELFPMGSVARVSFRLKQLRDAGYLSARPLGVVSAGRLGYYLGPKAPVLFPDPIEQRVVASMRTQVAQLAPEGLMHRMMVDSVHIRFLTAARDYANYKLLTWVDQYSPWWEDLRQYGVPFQADAYGEWLMLFAFDTLHTFFLEVDRGTERGSVVREKIERYIHYAESKEYERQFAAGPFRVLVITSSSRRMDGLLQLAKTRTDGLFWFTTWDRFKNARLLDAYWVRPCHAGFHALVPHL